MPLVANIKTKSLVTFQLLVGEGETDVTSNFGIKNMVVYRECNRIPTANILIIDGNAATQEFTASNEDTFKPGEKIHIKSGYQFEDETIFKGIVTKHTIKSNKNTSYLLIECKDEAFKLTLAKKNKIFYESTESEIFEEIIKDNGLESDIESTTYKHNELVQYYTTDWDFIQTRTQINNKICLVEDGTIVIKEPDLAQTSEHKAIYGDNVFAFEAEIDARNQYEVFEASTWNFSDQEIVTKTAENADLNTTGNITSSDLARAAGSNSVALKHTGKIPDEILQSWVDGKSMLQQMSKICGTVQIQGVHDILPGKLLTLEGMSNRFNGDVFVSAVNHEIEDGNWLTTIKFGLDNEWFSETYKVSQIPAAGMLPAINGLHIGVVSALEGDPEEEHRIQVKLPIISEEEEGVWARVLALHAGENFGVHFLPEIGNEVLVGFLNDDPNQAIILGALFSNTNTSPIEYSDDNFEKVIMTKSEIKITLNDELKSITLDTPEGKMISIDDDAAEITIKDENDNIIVMNSDGISMTSGKDIILSATGDVKIDGVNVEIVASAGFKAEASSTAEVSGSASTTIKGGVVQIN